MANPENIAPHRFTSDQNREEAARNGAKGGKASGKARREKRALSDAFRALLEMPEKAGEATALDELESMEGLEAANLTAQDRIALAMTGKAMKGDTRAFESIRDTVKKSAAQEDYETRERIRRASEEIERMIEEHQEEERLKLECLRELFEMPNLPDNVREGLIDLYHFDAKYCGVEVPPLVGGNPPKKWKERKAQEE